MKMKKTFALLLAACMSLSLVACGGNTKKKEISNNESVVSETQNGAKDSVVIAIGTEPETLDPTQGWGHGNSPIVQSTLVKYTADLTFEKDLATDYKLSEEFQPLRPYLHKTLGCSYYVLGNEPEATKHLNLAISLLPEVMTDDSLIQEILSEYRGKE